MFDPYSLDGAPSSSGSKVVDHNAANVTDAVRPRPRSTVVREKRSKVEMQPLAVKRSEMQPSYAQNLGVTHGICGYLLHGLGIVEGFFGTIRVSPSCCCRLPFHTVNQGSVGLVSRFGQFYKTVDPGLVQVNVCTETIKIVNVKTQIIPIDPQIVTTRDNVKVEIESDIYFQICNPYQATFDIANLHDVLIERTQLTFRQVVGAREKRSVFTDREAIASEIAEIVGEVANKWGVAVESILIKDISTDLSAAAHRRSVAKPGVIATDIQSIKLSKNILRKPRP